MISYLILLSMIFVQTFSMLFLGANWNTSIVAALISIMVLFMSTNMVQFTIETTQLETMRRELMVHSSAPNIYFSISAVDKFRVLTCNTAASNLLGFNLQDLKTLHIFDLFQEKSHAELEDILKRATNSEQYLHCPQLFLRTKAHLQQEQINDSDPNIQETIVSLYVCPVFDTEDKLISFNVIMNEITEKIKLMRELEKEKEMAINASNAKSNFLAVMSHELKTPLNAVLGMTDLLSKTRLDNEQADYADTIANSSKILLSLINDILDFSRIESGTVELEIRPFDLHMSLHQVSRCIIQQAKQKGLQLHFDIKSSVTQFVQGDEYRLIQILLNLVSLH
jgi:nitrogen-specific signal transduction histidine kinase